jgi:FkbM family methyltransferase
MYKFLARWPQAQQQALRVLIHLPARKRLVDHLGNRLIVDPTELSGRYLYYEKTYDAQIFEFLSSKLSRYRRVLDVGANIGVYTVFFAKSVAQVEAFEPVPKIAERLRQNLRLNQLTNARIHELCVSDSTETVQFASAPHENWGIGRISSKETGMTLECTTLDTFLEGEISEPTLIKMDIEGAEWMALKGASRAFGNRKARLDLLLEVHPEEIAEYGGSVAQVAELLRAAGFVLQAITQQGLKALEQAPTARFWFAESDKN